jgi:hypothetical protein
MLAATQVAVTILAGARFSATGTRSAEGALVHDLAAPGEEVQLRGHIIDSTMLPKALDAVMDLGGEFEILGDQVGRRRTSESSCRIKITGPDERALSGILDRLEDLGAELVAEKDAQTKPAPRDGALPVDFYSTSNMETSVRVKGKWIPVEGTEMDVAILIDAKANRAWTRPIIHVKKGEPVVVGHDGIRECSRSERAPDRDLLVHDSSISSEKPKKLVIHEVAKEMRAIKAARGGRSWSSPAPRSCTAAPGRTSAASSGTATWTCSSAGTRSRRTTWNPRFSAPASA